MSDSTKTDVRFPGIPTTADGSGTVSWVETHITQGACAYPITSSTVMGSNYAQAVANGQTNLWGEKLIFMEPESEHSTASAAEGFAVAGGRVTNFTSGQGLILMKEVLYVIAGKRLPVVFHIGARALTSQGLNVHAGHDDIMGVADTGWGLVIGKNAQAAGDLALITRRAAEDSQTPFMNAQDGFLTTHTIENVVLPEPDLMKQYIGDPNEKLTNLMNPKIPMMSGVVQNQDSYMKGKIAQRYFYDRVKPILKAAMDEYYELTGRRYDLVESYKMNDAEYAIVCMGGMAETAEVTCDYMRTEMGLKVGVVHVTSFRPFPGPEIVDALRNVKAFAVIERMDNPMGQSNPLTAEIKAAFADALVGTEGYPRIHRMPVVYSGSAGLGSRDVRPGDFIATVKNMMDEGARYFTLGIIHPLALDSSHDPDVRPAGSFSMRGHSVGGFGSVTTNKVIATIVGDLFDLYVQAYPKYGSEKKGLPTTYYMTAAEEPIRTHCEMNFVEFVPLNDVNAFSTGNPLKGLQPGGTVFMQSISTDPKSAWENIPAYARRIIREKQLRVLYLDAAGIAREVASVPDLQVRMQGIVLLGVFLKSTPFLERRNISQEELMGGVEKSLRKYFGKRSEQVIQDNLTCVRRGFAEVQEIPRTVIDEDVPAVSHPEQFKVSDIMHQGVIACRPTTPLAKLAKAMDEQHVGAIVVVDQEGNLQGLVSSTDILRARSGNGNGNGHSNGNGNGNGSSNGQTKFWADLESSQVMTANVITTTPNESLSDAMQKLVTNRIHRLVVVEQENGHKRPVGMVSAMDLTRVG
ncbi:MAG: 2-oxoacid:acceptor oxidoreductase family protein [Caldilineaceae bacterium]|nr:2-oxoacid:acceptor oxidoreductase family protein [Caldilineaceae bacterium]